MTVSENNFPIMSRRPEAIAVISQRYFTGPQGAICTISMTTPGSIFLAVPERSIMAITQCP